MIKVGDKLFSDYDQIEEAVVKEVTLTPKDPYLDYTVVVEAKMHYTSLKGPQFSPRNIYSSSHHIDPHHTNNRDWSESCSLTFGKVFFFTSEEKRKQFNVDYRKHMRNYHLNMAESYK